MSALACALPLLFALAAPPARPAVAHPFLRDGHDVRHVLVSFGAVVQGGAALRWIGMERDRAELTAIGVAAALGIAKETWDLAHGGRVDPIDLAWDAVGIALGALLAGATR